MDYAHWLLPEGIDEFLPPRSLLLEQQRRRMLDLFDSWGYELIIPPMMEYLESLTSGVGQDLAPQMFKLMDQLSGRQLGIRTDITPQAARVDAHQLRKEQPTRLCYLGEVMRTLPNGLGGSRSQIQLGAELFGHSGIESDFEILSLMMAAIGCTGVQDIYLDLGHVGIYRTLIQDADLDGPLESRIFSAMQRKDLPWLQSQMDDGTLDACTGARLIALAQLNGEAAETLALAHEQLGDSQRVKSALAELQQTAEWVGQHFPDTPLYMDLAELRGYRYQTGLVFAAFIETEGHEIARGGRYDAIGETFGRARPATGFSADLLKLMALAHQSETASKPRVAAPWQFSARLHEKKASLRKQGYQVINMLPGQQADAQAMGCQHELIEQSGEWVLHELPPNA
ncbi:MAG: ATP phosphoribosyltransferase regulatory subunit [gamma proteobacterium symbiont of Bathyaustriella thionipta]|nr:ATP phosphoribosyltransferase regulatory subunit [gamma proteobacterium symbiont of Bathyaustriella thionipta]